MKKINIVPVIAAGALLTFFIRRAYVAAPGSAYRAPAA